MDSPVQAMTYLAATFRVSTFGRDVECGPFHLFPGRARSDVKHGRRTPSTLREALAPGRRLPLMSASDTYTCRSARRQTTTTGVIALVQISLERALYA